MDPICKIRFDDKLKTTDSYRKIPFSLNDRIKKILLDHKKEQQEIFKNARAIKDRHGNGMKNNILFWVEIITHMFLKVYLMLFANFVLNII